MSLRKLSLRLMGTPSNLLNWDRAMMMAAALVKPMITGWDSRLTMAPMRNRPRASWMTPTIKASRMARAMYWPEPAVARGARAEAVSRATMATGPVESWRDDPHRAPAITGRKAA